MIGIQKSNAEVSDVSASALINNTISGLSGSNNTQTQMSFRKKAVGGFEYHGIADEKYEQKKKEMEDNLGEWKVIDNLDFEEDTSPLDELDNFNAEEMRLGRSSFKDDGDLTES